VTDASDLDLGAALERDGPLSREAALALLDRAGDLLTTADFLDAARHYHRVIGFDDASITGAAMLGLGEALHRLDRDDEALSTWLEVTRLPETPSTYPAWRNVAAARVRAGDLPGALAAYRQAERRAPPEDRAEIASRLGWLAKETGDRRAAGRYFARARGDVGLSVSLVLIGITSVISLTTLFSPDGDAIVGALALSKPELARGEIWRLWTVTLVHGSLIHLLFNMYALWLAGPLVERMYGRGLFMAFYLLFALAGSLATFALGGAAGGVGASGAIFGLFGVLFAAQRIHHPVIDRQGRMFLGQLGGLLAINLILSFFLAGIIDVWAHLGGLIAGAWIGLLFPPARVPTLRTMWQRPPAVPGLGPAGAGGGGVVAVRLIGLVALFGLLAASYAMGLSRWG
jgi:membrane associated rhomboid family serine protease